MECSGKLVEFMPSPEYSSYLTKVMSRTVGSLIPILVPQVPTCAGEDPRDWQQLKIPWTSGMVSRLPVML